MTDKFELKNLARERASRNLGPDDSLSRSDVTKKSFEIKGSINDVNRKLGPDNQISVADLRDPRRARELKKTLDYGTKKKLGLL